MALTLTRRQLTNDLTEVGETGPKAFKLYGNISTNQRAFIRRHRGSRPGSLSSFTSVTAFFWVQTISQKLFFPPDKAFRFRLGRTNNNQRCFFFIKRLQSRFVAGTGRARFINSFGMPLSSTNHSDFLSDKDIVGGSKSCDVPEDFKAISVLRRGSFTAVPMSRMIVFKGTDVEESGKMRNYYLVRIPLVKFSRSRNTAISKFLILFAPWWGGLARINWKSSRNLLPRWC